MNDQITIEFFKTIRTLANSKSPHVNELIDLNRLIITKIFKTEKFRMTSYGERKIQVIKVIREWTGLGLKEAKEFVESVPVMLDLQKNPNETQFFINDLRKAGATIEVRNV